jgi:ABC-type multidrug transport system fused ATPase/permease subunit
MLLISFDLSKILELFFRPLLRIWLPLGFVLIGTLVAAFFFPFRIYLAGTFLLTILFLALFTYQSQYVIRYWYKERQSFSEAEHYTILVVLAIYISTLFGVANYAIHQYDSSSFITDESFVKNENNRQIKSIMRDIEESEKKISSSEKIAFYVRSLPDTKFRIIDETGWLEMFSSVRTYKIDLPGEEVKLNVLCSQDEGALYCILKAKVDEFEFTLDGRSTSMLPLPAKEATRDDIVRTFESRAGWEKVNWLEPLNREQERLKKERENDFSSPAISLYLFMYQSAMSMLGSDPGYLKPANFLTRSVAFLYAAFKLIFFSIFASLIVLKRWAVSPEETPHKNADEALPINPS